VIAAQALAILSALTLVGGAAFADAPPPPPRPFIVTLANTTSWPPARVDLEQCDAAACAHPGLEDTLTCSGRTCSGYQAGFPVSARLVLTLPDRRMLKSNVFTTTGATPGYLATITAGGVVVRPQR
jgi:hypothetical protein